MKEIKIKVEFTDGYEKRFTEACLRQLSKAQKNHEKKKTEKSA